MVVFNYAELFFKPGSWETGLVATAKRVATFCRAAKASRYQLYVHLDDGSATPEAARKWRKRREKECGSEAPKRMPVGCAQLLGELFTAFGAVVRYSIVDNDDTIAAYAAASSSKILISKDSDFFRYTPSGSLHIFQDVFVAAGKLQLVPAKRTEKKATTSSRKILSPPPPTNPSRAFLEKTLEGSFLYLRGAATGRPGLIPSPHLQVRQLRAALYARLRVPSVTEELASCSAAGKAVWDTSVNEAAPDLEHLLDLPAEALHARFFDTEEHKLTLANPKLSPIDHANHSFATKIIISEIIAAATSKTGILSHLLPLLSRPSHDALLLTLPISGLSPASSSL